MQRLSTPAPRVSSRRLQRWRFMPECSRGGRAGAADGLDGYDQTAIRFAASALLVIPSAVHAARPAMRRMGGRAVLAVLVLGGAPYSCVFLGGLVFAPISYGVAIVSALQPMVVMLLGVALFAHRPGRPAVVGTGICFLGLAVMLDGADTPAGDSSLLGIALFLLPAALWGGYAVALGLWRIAARDLLVVSIPLSALLYLPAYLAWRGTGTLLTAPAEALLLQALYQGLLVGVVALLLYAWAVERAGAELIAALAPAMPAAAVLVGQVFLGEAPGPLGWFGLALVSLGLGIGVYRPGWQKVVARQSAGPCDRSNRRRSTA